MSIIKDSVSVAQDIDTIIDKVGAGAQLLERYGDVLGIIQNLDAVKLTAKQKERLTAAFKFRYAYSTERCSINSPSDAANMMQFIETAQKEELWVLIMNIKNHVLDKVKVYEGSVCSSQVRVGEVLRPAIIRNATSIIVIHNHPSGDPTPSPDDVAVTRGLVQAGKLMDIQVLDHLVIGENGKWVSLKERGLGFT